MRRTSRTSTAWMARLLLSASKRPQHGGPESRTAVGAAAADGDPAADRDKSESSSNEKARALRLGLFLSAGRSFYSASCGQASEPVA